MSTISKAIKKDWDSKEEVATSLVRNRLAYMSMHFKADTLLSLASESMVEPRDIGPRHRPEIVEKMGPMYTAMAKEWVKYSSYMMEHDSMSEEVRARWFNERGAINNTIRKYPWIAVYWDPNIPGNEQGPSQIADRLFNSLEVIPFAKEFRRVASCFNTRINIPVVHPAYLSEHLKHIMSPQVIMTEEYYWVHYFCASGKSLYDIKKALTAMVDMPRTPGITRAIDLLDSYFRSRGDMKDSMAVEDFKFADPANYMLMSREYIEPHNRSMTMLLSDPAILMFHLADEPRRRAESNLFNLLTTTMLRELPDGCGAPLMEAEVERKSWAKRQITRLSESNIKLLEYTTENDIRMVYTTNGYTMVELEAWLMTAKNKEPVRRVPASSDHKNLLSHLPLKRPLHPPRSTN